MKRPSRTRRLGIESLETRRLLAGDLSTNLAEPMDANGDLVVDSLDLVKVLSALLLSAEGQEVSGMVDVDDDGFLTPADLLPPFQHLLSDQVSPEVQGQYIPPIPAEIAAMAGVPQGNATLVGRIYDASGVADVELQLNGVPMQDVALEEGGAFVIETFPNADPNALSLVVTDVRGNTTTVSAADLTFPEPEAEPEPVAGAEAEAPANWGVTLQNGQLELVGTKYNDYASVWQWNDQLWVYASFFGTFPEQPIQYIHQVPLPGFRWYDVADVDQISFFGFGGSDVFLAETWIPTEQFGGDGNDYLLGGHAADQIFGDAGNDFLKGRGGNDFIHTGSGYDVAKGGDGNDELTSGNGQTVKVLYGGLGNDILRGRGAFNYFYDREGANLFDGLPSTVDYAFGNLDSVYIDIDFIFLN